MLLAEGIVGHSTIWYCIASIGYLYLAYRLGFPECMWAIAAREFKLLVVQYGQLLCACSLKPS